MSRIVKFEHRFQSDEALIGDEIAHQLQGILEMKMMRSLGQN